ncbi:wax ester/triacylglycerol synthase domain-containing protein [Streptomyces sp. NPDC026206]|uniref:wax ester/triacylglycerol synthase domain-containing protein n=1 Tax=Streptomyces sp. NPDC026206 TaxID=3157089 RepID=UPI00340A962F
MNSPFSLRASALDRAFLAFGSRNPDARLDVGAILYAEGEAPTVADLRCLVDGALHELPVLSHALRGSASAVAWAPVPDFQVVRHVVETVVAGEGRTCVENEVQRLWAGPLPSALDWEMRLVRPSSGHGWALSYRVHHGRQDGVAIAQMLQILVTPAGPGPVPRPAAGKGVGTGMGRFLRALGTGAAMYAGYRRFPPTGLGAEWELSGRRRISTAATSLPRLRSVAHAAGGTVNDVHLAALAGAVRAWCLETGRTPAPLAVAVPLNVRRAEESSTWGNRCFLRRVWLPCQEGDPQLRLLQTVKATTVLKSARVRQTAQDLLHGSPAWLVKFALHRVLDARYAPVISSYVPCGEDEAAVPPSLTDVVPMTLLPPGHPFNVGLTTYGTTAQIAVISDVAVPGVDRLPVLWQQAAVQLWEAILSSPPAPRHPADGRVGVPAGGRARS